MIRTGQSFKDLRAEVVSRGYSKCKGPEAEMSLLHLRD